MSDILVARNVPHEGVGLFEDIFTAEHLSYDIVELGEDSGLPSPDNYRAVLIFGGLESANDDSLKVEQEYAQIKLAQEYGVPLLGICLAHHVIAKVAGGVVAKCAQKEVGFRDPCGEPYEVKLTAEGKASPLLRGVPQRFKVFELHGEEVQSLIPDIEVLGTGSHTEYQIIQIKGYKIYGLQPHLELTPSMLAQWADEEPYLVNTDRGLLLAELEALQPAYSQIGHTIARNFLKIANLIS